ncbi:hypothetical protein [Gloeocapsa sp. PCC 73106]|uniref:hypothetical protein n=1 Tax=Gloeocapsa sp. PCC 73106 TaxID=102232 RepID=UPI0002ABB48D|nr:hypothetical protein [Gloeocapsa sp. PCC 73106]ELR96669.1 hypothetical protein GLO73106DRAFT_00004650 [Gloeocapsa sp. PCC 73106]
MLYSEEFFREVRSPLAPGGIFVEWNVGWGTAQTFQSVFPYVTQLSINQDLSVLVGSDHPIDFNREALLSKLKNPDVINFLQNAEVDVEALRQDILSTSFTQYSQSQDGQPKTVTTDLFPRSEYYLNKPLFAD